MIMSRFFTRQKFIPFLSGCLMTLNFVIFWAIPVAGMGSIYKQLLKKYLQPVYVMLDTSPRLRTFAANHIYTNPKHADFFAMSLLAVVNCSITIPTVFYWQLRYGNLPAWLIALYYCSWVGVGGSVMGAAYGLAHKEGHMPRLYKEGVRKLFGNFFENALGLFFGNVPWNFTVSHVKIHHGLNGSMGDTFYEWDFDRSDFGCFMLYVHRVSLHMIGYSSIKFLRCNNKNEAADLLQQGVYTYLAAAAGILALTRSISFLFWVFLQPLLCMTYFLALINIGFHGFIENDAKGNSIPCINSCTIVDGEDDFFGEDDHMTHHYSAATYYKDLPAYQRSKQDEWKKLKASVFQKLSIVELSIFILFGLWEKLAEHYVDYSGQLSKEQIMHMLRERAQRVELSYEQYQEYLDNPTIEARKDMVSSVRAAPEPDEKRASG